MTRNTSNLLPTLRVVDLQVLTTPEMDFHSPVYGSYIMNLMMRSEQMNSNWILDWKSKLPATSVNQLSSVERISWGTFVLMSIVGFSFALKTSESYLRIFGMERLWNSHKHVHRKRIAPCRCGLPLRFHLRSLDGWHSLHGRSIEITQKNIQKFFKTQFFKIQHDLWHCLRCWLLVFFFKSTPDDTWRWRVRLSVWKPLYYVVVDFDARWC